jgi:hypothetical protein
MQRLHRAFAQKPGLFRPFHIAIRHIDGLAIVSHLAIIAVAFLIWVGAIKMVVAIIAPVQP